MPFGAGAGRLIGFALAAAYGLAASTEELVADIIRPAFHHVTIKTSRLDEMVQWYRVVIGAEVTFQDANNAWTTNDDANHRVAFLSVPGLADDPDKVKHNGMHHSAFEYANFGDLIQSYERLRNEGIRPAFCLDHGLTISIYYRDPEGNFVELQSDNFGDWKASSHFMRTSEDFRANPIGTFFDPEKVCRAHHDGQPFQALQRDIRDGKFIPDVIPPIGLPV